MSGTVTNLSTIDNFDETEYIDLIERGLRKYLCDVVRGENDKYEILVKNISQVEVTNKIQTYLDFTTQQIIFFFDIVQIDKDVCVRLKRH